MKMAVFAAVIGMIIGTIVASIASAAFGIDILYLTPVIAGGGWLGFSLVHREE